MQINPIRNVAIIAHVDHGKTTLVDQLLKQSGAFRENEEVDERALDNDDIEKERGITIFSSNASVNYKGTRINIVDTPGHADFGGQVERVLGTVDSVLLIVDAWDGPMAQTRFVTKKALERGIRPIVVINKIDRDGCEPQRALDQVFDLFCELEANDEQLEFPHIFACGRAGTCRLEMDQEDSDLEPMLDMIVREVPTLPGDANDEPLFQISTLQYDPFLGRLATGRLTKGTLKAGQTINQSHPDGSFTKVRITKLLKYQGITLKETEDAHYGEIISIAGIPEFDIGDTISGLENPVCLEYPKLDPPTLSMNFSINTSPLAGNSGGKFLTGNHLQERLERASMGDPALHVEKSDEAGTFRVSGRGVLHLSILIENMRRELYEFSVGAPSVIYKEENGKRLEPMETFRVEVPEEYSGPIIELLGTRKGEMKNMEQVDGVVHVEYLIPSRALIGLRTKLLSLSKGYAITQSLFDGYEPFKGDIPGRANGVLISMEKGETTPYSLWKLADRGVMFISPQTEVYEGMIIGEHNRENDLTVNCTKGKQLTNVRASGSDDSIILAPPRELTLEDFVTYIERDELVEITPDAMRLRKVHLTENARKANKNK